MSAGLLLELRCHVRPGANALVAITVDGTEHQFELNPTIDWVPSSTRQKSQKIELYLDVTPTDEYKEFDFSISSKNSDLLICDYLTSRGIFQISSQPVWAGESTWQPYGLAGHVGDNAEFSGNGSLQIMDGQTVNFKGSVLNTFPAIRIQNG